MKIDIDNLIEKHKNSNEYAKYTMFCSVPAFKELQRLMKNEYAIEDYPDENSMWRHIAETAKTGYREGTVKFNNFEINVFSTMRIMGDYVIMESESIALINVNVLFKNSK